MQPVQGELVIILTSEEAEALARALATLAGRQGAGEAKTLQTIQEKLRAAREKMI